MGDVFSQASNNQCERSPLSFDLRQQVEGGEGLATAAPSVSCDHKPLVKILRLPEVMARIGLRRAAIYQHIAQGSFPKQISLGARSVGWLESEINAWIETRIQASRPVPGISSKPENYMP